MTSHEKIINLLRGESETGFPAFSENIRGKYIKKCAIFNL
jgi:hypothetical protein